MMKRAFAEISGHHLEQQRPKRKEEGHTIYASDGTERDEANVERNGCMALLNEGDSETHAKVDSTGKNAEASAIGSFSQKEFSSSDAVLNQEDDTFSDSSRSCPERSIYFSATRPTNRDCQRSNSSQSDQARLSQVDQPFTSSDSSSEATHAAAANNHLSIDILPVEKDRLPENLDTVFKESIIHDDFENHNDLKSINLVGAVGRSYTPVDVTVGYPDNNEMILETNFSSNNLNSGLAELTGDILEIQNNINGEIASQSYLNEGPSFATEQDMVDRTSIDLSCSAEGVWQHKLHSVPPLTECGWVERSFKKKTQPTVSEIMNCTMFEENPSERSFSSAISIEINQKVLYTNFKGELNLPPSPITGVINCFVSKPNGDTEHLDSFNEEDTAFSFQTPNRSFSKEKPKNEIGFGMQAALDSEVVSIGIQDIGSIPLERSLTYGTRKKLIVLDLNGLLCDIVNDYYSSYVVIKKVGGKPFFKRPFCDEFLRFCFDNFHIGIWSSRRKYNVDIALDYLMGEFKHKLLFCWDQSKCTYTGERTIENHNKPLLLKELKKLWNKEESDLPWEKGDFSPSNTLLLDDSPYKALRNPPHTAIFPYPYQYTDEKDNSLGPGGDIRVYLEQLLSSDNVQRFVEQHPFGQPAIAASDQHWHFYCQIMKSNSTQLS